MARKQTRRAVSLNTTTYQQIKNWCNAHDVSMSSFVEERIADFFNGVQRTAEETKKNIEDEFYLGSDQPKVRPTPAKKVSPTGGGYHEF